MLYLKINLTMNKYCTLILYVVASLSSFSYLYTDDLRFAFLTTWIFMGIYCIATLRNRGEINITFNEPQQQKEPDNERDSDRN